MRCLACSGSSWKLLPIPVADRSISTSGTIFHEPLAREQCTTCGFLQKKDRKLLGQGRFYEERYQTYYERPASDAFDRARYVAMAEWMASLLTADFRPRSILDVGCGAGWSMKVTKDLYPGATIVGVEPSAVNAQRGRSAGFDVIEARLGDALRDRTYDLIYSNNVLQHATDPGAFFNDLAGFLSEQGRIALLLPDASEASHEMMWCDHNFSFRPQDVASFAARAGLHLHAWQPNPQNNSLLNKQMVILTRFNYPRGVYPASKLSAEALFSERSFYMTKWKGLDNELVRRTSGHERVFNFGASMWSWLLAGYCPNYWNSVRACLVDEGAGQCIDKPVLSPADVEFAKTDCVVLGINPVSQQTVATRFRDRAPTVVTWSDLILN
jgi:SAM-dependent methyltransferase